MDLTFIVNLEIDFIPLLENMEMNCKKSIYIVNITQEYLVNKFFKLLETYNLLNKHTIIFKNKPFLKNLNLILIEIIDKIKINEFVDLIPLNSDSIIKQNNQNFNFIFIIN